MLFLYIPDVMD